MAYIPLEKAIYKDFKGGQNSATHPTNIKDNELSSINNFTINDDGSLVLSRGVEQIGSGSLGNLHVRNLTKISVGNFETFCFKYDNRIFFNDFVTVLNTTPVSGGNWTKLNFFKMENVRLERGSEAFDYISFVPYTINKPRFWQPGIFGSATDRSLFLEQSSKNLLLDGGFESIHEINSVDSPWKVIVAAGVAHRAEKSSTFFQGGTQVPRRVGYGARHLWMNVTTVDRSVIVDQDVVVNQHANKRVSLSFRYWGNVRNGRFEFGISFFNVGGGSTGVFYDILIMGTRQTSAFYETTVTLPANTHSIRLTLVGATENIAGAFINVNVDNVKLEINPIATTWCETERDKEQLFINTNALFPNEGTIEYRHRPYYIYAPLEETVINDLIWGGVDDGFIIRRIYKRVGVTWNWYLEAVFMGANVGRIETIITPNINTVYYIVLRWTMSGVSLFLNGALIGSLTLSVIPPSGEIILSGEGMYDDIRISSTALTNAQISTVWAGGIPTLPNSISEYKLDFEGDLLAVKHYQGEWVSNTIDTLGYTARITNLIRKMRVINIPVKVEVRFSADNIVWGMWLEIDNLGRIIQTPLRFCQVKVSFLEIYKDIMWSHDFSRVILCEYRILNTYRQIGIANGLTDIINYRDGIIFTDYPQNPQRWKIPEDADGNAQHLLGSPPDAKYVKEVNNVYFLINSKEYPNAVFISDILNPEKWAFYNMLEVGDYDEITDVCKFKDYLVIGKRNHIWALVSKGVEEVALEKIHDIGVVGKSLLEVEGGLFFISADGLYISDLAKPVNITEKIKDVWDRVNKGRLNEVVAHYHQQKIYMSLPTGTADISIVVLNVLTGAFATYDTVIPASFTSIMRDNQYKLIAGIRGMVVVLDEKHHNIGVTTDIVGSVRTKDYDLGDPHLEKFIRRVVLHITSAARASILEVHPVIDGVIKTSLSIVVQYDESRSEKLYCVIPAKIGVFRARTIGFVLRQRSNIGGVSVRGISIEFWRESRRAYV